MSETRESYKTAGPAPAPLSIGIVGPEGVLRSIADVLHELQQSDVSLISSDGEQPRLFIEIGQPQTMDGLNQMDAVFMRLASCASRQGGVWRIEIGDPAPPAPVESPPSLVEAALHWERMLAAFEARPELPEEASYEDATRELRWAVQALLSGASYAAERAASTERSKG